MLCFAVVAGWGADLALFFGFLIGLLMMYVHHKNTNKAAIKIYLKVQHIYRRFGIKITSEKLTSQPKSLEVAVGISNESSPPESMKIPLTNQARQVAQSFVCLEKE